MLKWAEHSFPGDVNRPEEVSLGSVRKNIDIHEKYRKPM
jgi:hypothetical protein